MLVIMFCSWFCVHWRSLTTAATPADPESAPACQTCPPQYSEEGQVSYVLSEDAKRTLTASEVLEKIFLEMIGG